MFTLVAIIAGTVVMVGSIALGLALSYGGDYPLRRLREFIAALVNLALARPLYRFWLWWRYQEEWTGRHCEVATT